MWKLHDFRIGEIVEVQARDGVHLLRGWVEIVSISTRDEYGLLVLAPHQSPMTTQCASWNRACQLFPYLVTDLRQVPLFKYLQHSFCPIHPKEVIQKHSQAW